MKFRLKENHFMNHILCIHKETEFFSLIFVINRLNFHKIFTKTIIALVYNIFNIPSNFLIQVLSYTLLYYNKSILSFNFTKNKSLQDGLH